MKSLQMFEGIVEALNEIEMLSAFMSTVVNKTKKRSLLILIVYSSGFKLVTVFQTKNSLMERSQQSDRTNFLMHLSC